ncbi:MAG: CPBP family intramembrane metalloprotease [candidate division Zixibacteria bacterium]|nr:CPBP family intramembrane metalloprotease [candidate division Zixibacteria bacterium]
METETILTFLKTHITVTYTAAIITFTFTFAFLRKKQISFIEWNLGPPKQSGLLSLLAILATFLLMTLLISLGSEASDSSTRKYAGIDALSQLIGLLIVSLPVLSIMKWQKEPLATAGISKLTIRISLILGFIIGIGELFIGTGVSWLGNLNMMYFWALMQFVFVGFFEEFLFRGYLQTRLMRWLGTYKGWILASLMMSLSHISIIYGWHGKSLSDAFLLSFETFPISLALGYIYMKTGNITGPAIIHTFMNFASAVNEIGQISSDI